MVDKEEKGIRYYDQDILVKKYEVMMKFQKHNYFESAMHSKYNDDIMHQVRVEECQTFPNIMTIKMTKG
jgi:hypothetical protein